MNAQEKQLAAVFQKSAGLSPELSFAIMIGFCQSCKGAVDPDRIRELYDQSLAMAGKEVPAKE